MAVNKTTREIEAYLGAGFQQSKVAKIFNKSPVWIHTINQNIEKHEYERPEFSANDMACHSENRHWKSKLTVAKLKNKNILSKEQYNKLNNRSIKEWLYSYIKDKKYITRRRTLSDFMEYLNFDKNASESHEEIYRGVLNRLISFYKRLNDKGMIKKLNKYSYEIIKNEEVEEIKDIKIEFTSEVNDYKMTKDLMRTIIKMFSTRDYKIEGKISVNGIEQELRWDK